MDTQATSSHKRDEESDDETMNDEKIKEAMEAKIDENAEIIEIH